MMKKFAAMIFIASCAVSMGASAASAASAVGQCVYPKTVTKKNGNLEYKRPVQLFSSPSAEAPNPKPFTVFSAFTVKAESGKFIQLATVVDFNDPDSEKNAGKVVGWVKAADFDFIPFRNCNG